MVLSIFMSLLIYSSSQAEDLCVVNKPSKSGAIAERIRYLKTADGRTFTIIGQNHGDRQSLRSIEEIANYKNDSNELWTWTLESVAKSNKKALQDAAEEVAYLSDFLKKNPDVKYVGLETLPETVPDHFKHSEKVRDDLLTEFSRRKVQNLSTTPYILGFAGSATYLRMTEPGLMKNRIFFGAESERENTAHENALTHYETTLKTLKKQIQPDTLEGQDFIQKIHDTEKELLALYPAYNSEMDQKILESAMAKTPEKYKKATAVWISASLEEMKMMKARDQRIAENLISKEASTVMTIGQAHLDSVMSALANECRKQSTATRSPKPKSHSVKTAP